MEGIPIPWLVFYNCSYKVKNIPEQTEIFRNRAPLFGIILSGGARGDLHVVMVKSLCMKPTCR